MKLLLIPTFTIAFLLGNMVLSDNYDDNFATTITLTSLQGYSMDFDGEKKQLERIFLIVRMLFFLDNSPYSLIAEAENVVESYDKPTQANSPSGRVGFYL